MKLKKRIKSLLKQGLSAVGLLEWVKRRKELYHYKKDRLALNNLDAQRDFWKERLASSDWSAEQPYGYDWGDPENAQDRLGNYLAIQKRLIGLLAPGQSAMELGALGGKWTQYMLKVVDRVICVDINDVSKDYLVRRFGEDRIQFYLSSGSELKGIGNQSVDLIFCMDTLVRSSKKIIADYFQEFARVLRPGGRVYIHLPFREKEASRMKGFTNLSKKAIEKVVSDAGLDLIRFDDQVIVHGVMVEAGIQPKGAPR